jgi:hypothetical protein
MYKSLSEHVHTASMTHINLHQNLASLPLDIHERFKSVMGSAAKAAKIACELNLIVLGSPSAQLQHNLADFLLDQYSNKLKREYAG